MMSKLVHHSGPSAEVPKTPGFPLSATAVLATLLGAIVVVLTFRAVLPPRFGGNDSSDYSGFYRPVAERIVAGSGIVLANGAPATRYPPGYPLLLAGTLTVANWLGVPVEGAEAGFACLAMGVAAVFLFALSASVWPTPLAAVVPIGFLTYPLLLWAVKQPTSETAMLPFLYGAVWLAWCLLRGTRCVVWVSLACGVLCGAAMLIRPICLGLGVLLAMVVWALARNRSLRLRTFMAGCILAGNLLVVLPWEVWVYRQTGRVIPLSSGGVRSVRDGLSFAGDAKTYRQRIATSSGLKALMVDIERAYPTLKSTKAVAAFLWGEFREKPAAVMQLLIWKALRSWYATDTRRYEIPILFVQLFYAALLIPANRKAWRSGGDRKKVVQLLLGVLAYFWVMTFLALSIVRYMAPAIALTFAALPAVFAARRRETLASGALAARGR